MHFKVEQEIFEKLPNACFGVVVAKGIDNTKDYPQIYDWLESTDGMNIPLKRTVRPHTDHRNQGHY